MKESSNPLFAYVTGSRLGHQIWETIMHCAFANAASRRLIIFFPPRAINKAFSIMNSSNLRFVYLPNDSGHALKMILDVVRAEAGVSLELNLECDPRTFGYRFENDNCGLLFDALLSNRLNYKSRPFAIYSTRDYFKSELLRQSFNSLRIAPRFQVEGDELLLKIGLAKDDWFVCVHCRESSYLGDTQREWMNADISTYIPAFEEIVKRGGRIVRMGDPCSRKMPYLPGVIDYVHSPFYSNFADLVLASRARFFAASSNGVRCLPKLFQTPILGVNLYPLTPIEDSERSLSVYKKIFSKDRKELRSLKEILSDPMLCHRRTDKEYSEADLVVVRNSPEEITEAFIEMFVMTSDPVAFAHWTPEQIFFQMEMKKALNQSSHTRGYGDTVFFPERICRIGQRYFEQNWGGRTK